MRCAITWYFYQRLTRLMTITSRCNSTILTKLVIHGPFFVQFYVNAIEWYIYCRWNCVWRDMRQIISPSIVLELKLVDIPTLEYLIWERCVYIFMTQSITPNCSKEACLSEPSHQYQVHSLKQSYLCIRFCNDLRILMKWFVREWHMQYIPKHT